MFSKLKLIAIFLIAFSLMTSLAIADTAVYNSTYGAPYCADETNQCVAPSSLLLSLGGAIPTDEPNEPNTIDACIDSTNGFYGLDNNVEAITVEAVSGNITAGSQVTITGDLYDDGDYYLIAYTNSTSSINWNTIYGGTTPSDPVIKNITLDNVTGYHAIRIRTDVESLSTSTNENSCTQSAYNDRDDIVFYVGDYVAPEETDTCTYSGSGNWTIDLTDDCTINTNYDLGANEILLTNTGNVTFNSSINVTNFPEPSTNQNIYIDSNAYILVS